MSFGGQVGSCPVAEVMGTEMFTVTPETAVWSARQLVLENDVRHMLVLDQGTLAGIVGIDDLRFADRDARIGDCMTSPVLCITPDTTLQEAVDIMGANDIDCLPVVTGLFLIGIVTLEALATANLSPGEGWSLAAHHAEPEEFPFTSESSVLPAVTACVICASAHDVTAFGSPEDANDDPLILCARCRRSMRASQCS